MSAMAGPAWSSEPPHWLNGGEGGLEKTARLTGLSQFKHLRLHIYREGLRGKKKKTDRKLHPIGMSAGWRVTAEGLDLDATLGSELTLSNESTQQNLSTRPGPKETYALTMSDLWTSSTDETSPLRRASVSGPAVLFADLV
ncbi:Hypothetical protein SMAX5B_011505 [Scophthalmus maximus]|uniref:Uncharacterized protein n=1 Tax=Scophthalmus maximus TaxID=52904 RepID=A0A2U9BMX1_SCOMX|nr:Hypothetical protein SMAX5B_011505 [Scophthalmus maximus]